MYSQIVFVLNCCCIISGLQPFLDTDIDYAASPVDLQNLVSLEVKFVCSLLPLNQNDFRVDVIESYLQDFQATLLDDVGLQLNNFCNLVDRGVLDPTGLGYDAAKHALKIYKIIKRFLRLFKEIEETHFKNQIRDVVRTHLSRSDNFPKESDLTTAALGILKLNQLFQLPFSDFLLGIVGHLNTKCSLSLDDLVYLGKVALEYQLASQAVNTLDTIMQHPNYKSLSNPEEIESLMEAAIKMHDSKLTDGLAFEDIQYDSGPQLFSGILHNKSTMNFKNRVLVDAATLLKGVPMENFRAQLIPIAYKFAELCNTEQSIRNPAKDSTLKCFLASKSNPFYILNPLKVEVHNWSPFLVQYYDVVNENEITQLKNEVKGELRISRIVRSSEETSGAVTRQRTSSNSWIADYNDSKFHPLLLKIGRILNVTTDRHLSTENIQIAAYSPGGHYVPHTDAVFEPEILDKLDPTEFLRGDRIITFMIYLSDVEAGGATAFPVIGKVIKPKKGSAVFWFNLFSDGNIRRDTFHGGCSVLYGTKWIANKWIRSLDQMFHLQCSKHQYSSLSLDL